MGTQRVSFREIMGFVEIPATFISNSCRSRNCGAFDNSRGRIGALNYQFLFSSKLFI